jgi:hypothetical protein
MGFPETTAGRLCRSAARPAILLPAIAIALVTSAPASALTGYGVSAALRGGQTAFTARAAAPDNRARTCHKGSAKTHEGDLGRKFSPVACEQPPKSELNLPGAIDQTSASALAAIG